MPTEVVVWGLTNPNPNKLEVRGEEEKGGCGMLKKPQLKPRHVQKWPPFTGKQPFWLVIHREKQQRMNMSSPISIKELELD